jgi:iron complex transport system substrate-binding protein
VTRPFRPFVATLFLLFGLIACRGESDYGDGPPGNPATARIVTLSPHLAEIVFAVGAGDRLVGVSAYTDFPGQALDLPQVGDAFAVDHERLTLLRPDILLAWQSGTPEHVVDEIRQRGFRVEVVRTRSLADIQNALQQVGELLGNAERGAALAGSFAAEIDELRQRYANAASIRVFYQVSQRPLYTINSDHFVSELVAVCGGSNIFADLSDLAPAISVEAVLERNPEVLLASDDAGADTFVEWDRWPDLAANRLGNRYMLPAAEIGRATPRLLQGARVMCEVLDEARHQRDAENE